MINEDAIKKTQELEREITEIIIKYHVTNNVPKLVMTLDL